MSNKYGLLEVRQGAYKGRLFCLAAREIRIGRHIDNNIVLTDEGILEHHAKIIFVSGDYLIDALESKDGLCINGTFISQALLKSGDIIELGECHLLFHKDQVDSCLN